MTEPLAKHRDEVLYLVCSHVRIRAHERLCEGRLTIVLKAHGELGGGIQWNTSEPAWARLQLPDGVRPSSVSWAIIDPSLESVEGLPPIEVATNDPDGADGRFRQELLSWIFDRHLELGQDGAELRGVVEGGCLDFRLEYVGRSDHEALRRAVGQHHKLPLILGRTLLYEPHRLVYVLPCDLHVATFDPGETGRIPMQRLAVAQAEPGPSRELLTSVAEEALIAWLDPRHNRQNTGPRRFPDSKSAERLEELGFTDVGISFAELPDRFRITGEANFVDRSTKGYGWQLGTGS